MKLPPGAENGPAGAIIVTTASRPLRRRLRPLAWVALEEVALDAVAEEGRLVARTSARQVAQLLGVDPGTAAGALRTLRRHGLLVLEREKGPTGRFGLSVYVLGRVDGLSVGSPRVAEPSPVLTLVVAPEAAEPEMAPSHAGRRRVELSRLEISDKAVTDVAAVGTVGPRQDRLLVLKRRPAEAVAAQYAPAEGQGPRPRHRSRPRPGRRRYIALDGMEPPNRPGPTPDRHRRPGAPSQQRPPRAHRVGRARPASRRRVRPGASSRTGPCRQAPYARPMATTSALGRPCGRATAAGRQPVAQGDLPRVRHHRGPCPQQRRRDRSLDRTERSKHSNGYHRSGYRCLPDIPGSRHADAHRPRR